MNYLIGTDFSEEVLTTPTDLTSNGTPLYVATSSSLVLRSGWTASNILFLVLSSGAGSPSNPATVTRSPTWAPSGGTKSSTFSGVLAHRTIASLMIPLSFDAFKLHTHTTILSCICKTNQIFTILRKYNLKAYLIEWNKSDEATADVAWFVFTQIDLFHVECIGIGVLLAFDDFTNAHI